MPFAVRCSSCQSKFALPDAVYEERIAGRVVELSCKKCRAAIRVDGTQPRSGSSSQSRAAVSGSSSSSSQMVAASELGLPASKPQQEVDLPSPKASAKSNESAALPNIKPTVTRALKAPAHVDLGGKSGSRTPAPARIPLPKVAPANDAAQRIGEASRAPSPAAPSTIPIGRTKLIQVARAPESSASSETKRAQPPPLRRPPAKATMMGVAPPAAAVEAVRSARIPTTPMDFTPSASQELAAAQGVAEANASALASTVLASSAPGVPVALPAGAGSKLGKFGGTMLGLAPPERSALELVPEGVSPSGESALDPRTADTEEDEDSARVTVTDDTLTDSARNHDSSGFESEDATRVDLPKHGGARLEMTAPAVTAPLIASEQRVSESLPCLDVENELSEVSRPIAHAVPKRAPRRNGVRLLLAALVSVLGGATVVGWLVHEGHVNLPPAVHAAVVRVAPGLSERLGSVPAQAREGARTAPAQAAAIAVPVEQPPASAEPAGAEPAGAEPAGAGPAGAGPASEPAATVAPKTPTAERIEEVVPVEPAAPAPEVRAEPAEVAVPVQPVVAASEAPKVNAAAADSVARAAAPEKAAPEKAAPEKAVAGAIPQPGELSPRTAQPVGELPPGVDMSRVQYHTARRMLRAEKCHLQGRAVGEATVVMSFGADGRVSEASVHGEPIASAPVAQCVIAYAQSVVLPAPLGAEFSIAYPIALH